MHLHKHIVHVNTTHTHIKQSVQLSDPVRHRGAWALIRRYKPVLANLHTLVVPCPEWWCRNPPGPHPLADVRNAHMYLTYS